MAIEIMKLSLALFLLWGVVYVCYRDYRIDLFRQEVFCVRGELFEYAASDAVPFSGPEYRLLMNFMNDVIRYAHALTFSRFLIAHVLRTAYPSNRVTIISEWRKAVAQVESTEVRNALNAFHDRVAQAIAGQLVRRSVCLLVLILLLRLVHLLLGSGKRPQDIIKKDDLDKFESQVIEVEKQDSDAELATV